MKIMSTSFTESIKHEVELVSPARVFKNDQNSPDLANNRPARSLLFSKQLLRIGGAVV